MKLSRAPMEGRERGGPFTRDIDLSECRRVYSPEEVGGIHLPEIIMPGFLMLLAREVRGLDLDGHLSESPKVEGRVRQNSSTLYVGAADGKASVITLDDLPATLELAEEYTHLIYNPIANIGRFAEVNLVNSVGIHKYPAGNGGIGYHRDYKTDINLIGIFSIDGDARFHLARSREGDGEKSFTSRPGDLMLMRAHRDLSDQELKLDVFHRLESLSEDRFSIIFRNRVPRLSGT